MPQLPLPQAAPLPAWLFLPAPIRLRAVLPYPALWLPVPPPLVVVVPVRVLPVGNERLLWGAPRGSVAGVVAAVLLSVLLEPPAELDPVRPVLLARPPLLAVVPAGAVGLEQWLPLLLVPVVVLGLLVVILKVPGSKMGAVYIPSPDSASPRLTRSLRRRDTRSMGSLRRSTNCCRGRRG